MKPISSNNYNSTRYYDFLNKIKENTNFDLIKSLRNKNKNLKTFIKSAIVFILILKI